MSYVLETINDEYLEMIISDFSFYPEIKNEILYAIQEKVFTKKIAIDKNAMNYMFLAPDIIMNDNPNSTFFIVLKKRLYKVKLDNLFGNEAYIVGCKELDAELLKRVHSEASEAFKEYGRYGSSDEAFTPVFNMETF